MNVLIVKQFDFHPIYFICLQSYKPFVVGIRYEEPSTTSHTMNSIHPSIGKTFHAHRSHIPTHSAEYQLTQGDVSIVRELQLLPEWELQRVIVDLLGPKHEEITS